MRLLRPRLPTIAPLLLALSPLGLEGCGLGTFDETVCVNDGLSGLKPAEADYVALRGQSLNEVPEPISLVAEFGKPCTKAADAAACEAALGALAISPALLTEPGFDIGYSYDVVFTTGNTVGKVATRAELLTVLGEIDSPEDAVLLAFANGHRFGCDEPNARIEKDGTFVLLSRRGSGCGEGDDVVEYEVLVTPEGEVTEGESQVVEKGDPNCAIGRRPVGLRRRGSANAPRGPQQRSSALAEVGAFFASAAHLEAASVPAFRHLAAELAHHGAPKPLVRAAKRSAEEEVRHAKVVSRLSRRYGVRPRRPVVQPMAVRSLLDVAVDNASEGCVRETFGAIIAGVQARRSCDPIVRRALSAIAVDEARHAALSWAIDDWARQQLSPADAVRVLEARVQAANKLAREIRQPVGPMVMSHGGMPDVATSERLLRAMTANLLDLA